MVTNPLALTELREPIAYKVDEEELAALCKALAHPARIQILKILMDSPCICGEIVEVMHLAQSTVSAHLRILKQAGLVRGEIDGPRVCYCIDSTTVARFQVLINSLVDEAGSNPERACC